MLDGHNSIEAGGGMDLGLRGKVAIVAASSSGLGKATAMELAAAGARVVINARRADELRSAAREIESATGAEVLAIHGDLTNEDYVHNLVSETVNKFGGV